MDDLVADRHERYSLVNEGCDRVDVWDLVSTLDYSPFGKVLTRRSPYTPRYQFSTKEWDEEVGLCYYGYRFYSPVLGRWVNRDPIGERGGINLFAVVRNSPLQHIDQVGLEWKCITNSYPIGPLVTDCEAFGAPYTWWQLGWAQYEGGEGPPSCTCHREEIKAQYERCVKTQEWETRVECADECSNKNRLILTFRGAENLGTERNRKNLGRTGNSKSFPCLNGSGGEGLCELCCVGMCSQENFSSKPLLSDRPVFYQAINIWELHW